MRKARREDFGARRAAGQSQMDSGRCVVGDGGCDSAVGATIAGLSRWQFVGGRDHRDFAGFAARFALLTDVGSVQVQGSSPRVSYVIRKRSYAPSEEAARRQFEQMRISAIKNAEGAFIEGRLANRNLNRFNAEFLVQIPRQLDLVKVETHGGSLNFSSIAATVLGATGGGWVKLDDLDGSVKITSGGGNVEVGRLGADFSLTTGGGDVHIKNVAGQMRVNIGGGRVYVGSAKGAIIQTGAGSIEVHKCTGDLGASSGGGNLSLGDVTGAVQAETTGGKCASGQRPGTGAGHYRRRQC